MQRMDNYLTIIERYLEGSISASEKKTLQKWLAEEENHKILFRQKIKEWYAKQKDIPVDSNDAYMRFKQTIDEKAKEEIVFRPWIKIIKYAAILGGVILAGYYYTTLDRFTHKTNIDIVESSTSSMDKIKITDEEGTITLMSFDDKTDITNASGNLIGKKDQHQFIVQPNEATTETKYMEISIPKGKLFQLTLSDGTKVWLNAASTLKFPQHFIASEKHRTVYLEGEAFFDVTTNKKQPFVVKTSTVDVEVLGTQFNVSSYAEDTTVKTTLVEGAVVVNDQSENTGSLKLSPSYQAIYSKEKNVLDKKKVNTMLYTSWMDRKIILQNESFAEAYKRIERAYNVTIISQNRKLNNTNFTGEFDIENIEEILKTFSGTLKFTYEIDQNKILIHPEN
ncbi:FecR family protein [Aquimarina algiphila]|uniref:FecR family protein n=2 Tax=Aquimarina algiphila TaxID=2047982 RepID=A0A554VKN4_9FLAO|nr:FecR family protein [Aquimarina algiphila]